MKSPRRIRRETASVIGSSVATAALVVIFAGTGIAEWTGALSAASVERIDGLIDSFWPFVATALGLSGGHHVARAHVRRQEKRDAAEAGADDGAGDLHVVED